MTKSNRILASRAQATGGSIAGSDKCRVNLYIEPAEFEKIRSRATAMECGVGTICARIVKSWCDQEPPPLFIGAGEHQ